MTNHFAQRTRYRVLLILFVWSVGCLVGLFIANRAAATSPYLFPVPHRSSITISFLLSSLPIVLSHFIYSLCHFHLLLPLVFLKGLSFMYCYAYIHIIFGNAAWLVRYIVLFSDLVFVCLLLWFWLRCASCANSIRYNFRVCLIAGALIVLVDHYCVLPLGELILN